MFSPLQFFQEEVNLYSKHLVDEGLQKASDNDILKKGKNEERIILTFDLDFGDLLAAGGDSVPSTIIFRLRNQTPEPVGKKLLNVLKDRKKDLEKGAIIIVEESRYRLRRLPLASATKESR